LTLYLSWRSFILGLLGTARLLHLRGDGMQTLEEALFYSASAYATLGWTADYFPPEWRLIGAIEALVGFLMLGWSTAFVVATMNRLRD
jgi:hypothetical protein